MTDEPAGRWTTIYDRANHRVLFVAAQPHGTGHFGAIDLDETLSSEGCSLYRYLDADGSPGPVVFMEAELDDTGVPVAVPDGFDIDLMGSQAVWPGRLQRYVWWFDEVSLLSEAARPRTARALEFLRKFDKP